jgi:hypothetical protein
VAPPFRCTKSSSNDCGLNVVVVFVVVGSVVRMVNSRRGVVDTVEGLAVVASDVDDTDSEADLEEALDAS